MKEYRLRMGWWLLLAAGLPLLAACEVSSAEPDYSALRERMVKRQIEGRGVKHEATLKAMRKVARHRFVPEVMRSEAYRDHPLPIGHEQTISQPYIVAFMTEKLDPKENDRVLEIGTGSGYQAAVLAEMVREVYTIEIVPALGRRAKAALDRLEYDNVHVRIGDGYAGWPEKGPFDKVIVTCSPDHVPQPLIDQLAEGGRMMIPVGPVGFQRLYLLRKTDGKVKQEAVLPVRFVPMTGRAQEGRK